MATEFVQGARERGVGSASHATQPTNTDGRGQQSARVQDEQRFLESGTRPTPKHGPKSVEFEPEFAGAGGGGRQRFNTTVLRCDHLNTEPGTLAVAAQHKHDGDEQQQPPGAAE